MTMFQLRAFDWRKMHWFSKPKQLPGVGVKGEFHKATKECNVALEDLILW